MRIPKLLARRRAVSDARRPFRRDVACTAEAGLRVGMRAVGGVRVNGGGGGTHVFGFRKKKKRERGKY